MVMVLQHTLQEEGLRKLDLFNPGEENAEGGSSCCLHLPNRELQQRLNYMLLGCA